MESKLKSKHWWALLLLAGACWAQTHTEVTLEDAQSISGAKSFSQINNVCYADQQSGSDLGAKVNACDAKLGTTPGEIWINHSAGTSWTTAPTLTGPRRLKFIDGAGYSIALGVLAFTAKPVWLDCGGHQGAILNFTGGSGIAMKFNYATTASGSFYDWGYGISGCAIIGPGGSTGTLGNAGTGIQIADGSNTTIGFNAYNVQVSGFAIGITWGACSAFGTRISESNILNNTQNLVHTVCASGAIAENIKVDHSIFGWSNNTQTMNLNGVQIGGGSVEMNFDDVSFDGDQLAISTGLVNCVNCHFENPSGQTTNYYITQSGGVLTLVNPQFGQDSTSGSVPTAFINLSGGNLAADHVSAYNNNAGSAFPWLTFNGGGTATVGLRADVLNFAAHISAATSGTNNGYTVLCDGNPVCTFALNGNSIVLGASTGIKASGAASFLQNMIGTINGGGTAVGGLTCSAAVEDVHVLATNCTAGCSAGGTCASGGSNHCELYCGASGAWKETGLGP